VADICFRPSRAKQVDSEFSDRVGHSEAWCHTPWHYDLNLDVLFIIRSMTILIILHVYAATLAGDRCLFTPLAFRILCCLR
jgi:hypothetical protein